MLFKTYRAAPLDLMTRFNAPRSIDLRRICSRLQTATASLLISKSTRISMYAVANRHRSAVHPRKTASNWAHYAGMIRSIFPLAWDFYTSCIIQKRDCRHLATAPFPEVDRSRAIAFRAGSRSSRIRAIRYIFLFAV